VPKAGREFLGEEGILKEEGVKSEVSIIVLKRATK